MRNAIYRSEIGMEAPGRSVNRAASRPLLPDRRTVVAHSPLRTFQHALTEEYRRW
jgi:hypothetical protein